MCKNRKPLDVITVGFFFRQEWNIDFFLRGIHIGKNEQKNRLLRDFFEQQNDEGENCQQRKARTSHPIRIAQFHEKSFFKSTKN